MTDLQKRVCITLAVLGLYSLGTYIPIPGVDIEPYLALFADENSRVSRTLLWQPGRSLQFLSIFAFGIVPYVAAALLVRLASLVFARLRDMEDGPPSERRKIVLGTRLLALLLVGLQAYSLATGFEVRDSFLGPIVAEPGVAFRSVATATVIGGLIVIMWLADQITRHGVGNGVALILFVDVTADLPRRLVSFVELTRTGAISLTEALGLIALAVAVVALITILFRASPNVLVRYPQQQAGGRTMAATTIALPLGFIIGGFVPAIFAYWFFSLLLSVLSVTVHGGGGYVIEGWIAWFWFGHPVRVTLIAILIIAMAYPYALAVARPRKAAQFLESKGGALLGSAPGAETERALRGHLLRLSLIGGCLLALVYVVPEILSRAFPLSPGWIGGAGFLVAVAVALDTMRDISLRRHWGGGRPPPSEAVAIAMERPERSGISAEGR